MKSWFIAWIGIFAFMSIKTVSAQVEALPPAKAITSVKLSEWKDNNPICYCIVDKDASFPGGEKALMQFIYSNYKLTPKPKGKIITYFIVEKDGSISDIQILKGLTIEANNEAIRVIQLMPKWLPNIANGKALPVAYTLPFVFGSLQNFQN